MFKALKVLIIVSVVYLGYVNFVQGSKAEKIALQAADVGKQTVVLGKDGLDKVNTKVLEVVK